MDSLTHNVRRANWLTIINQCQERPANVTIRHGAVTLEISNDISEDVLSLLLKEVIHA